MQELKSIKCGFWLLKSMSINVRKIATGKQGNFTKLSVNTLDFCACHSEPLTLKPRAGPCHGVPGLYWKYQCTSHRTSEPQEDLGKNMPASYWGPSGQTDPPLGTDSESHTRIMSFTGKASWATCTLSSSSISARAQGCLPYVTFHHSLPFTLCSNSTKPLRGLHFICCLCAFVQACLDQNVLNWVTSTYLLGSSLGITTFRNLNVAMIMNVVASKPKKTEG